MKKLLLIFTMLFSAIILHSEVFTDDVGRKVEVRTPVTSIICLSPAHTEMIFWMGLQDRLMAVSTNCDYPEATKKLAKAGSFMNPDVEKIVSMHPDVVISGGGVQKKAIAKLEELNIPVLVLYPKNVDRDIWNSINTIGRLIDEPVKARNKVIEYERMMDEVTRKDSYELKVYMEMWSEPVMAVGKASFINQMLHLSGGRNIFGTTGSEYPKVSPEEIIKRDPDVIILLYKPEKGYMDRPYFRQTNAGKKGNIYIFDNVDILLRAGPRVPLGIRELRRIMDKAEAKI
jgi:iron complex transport system substrate-binding protein